MSYGNWIMTRSVSQQDGPESIKLLLDTRNMPALADAFGVVRPRNFPIMHIYFGYFDPSAVQARTPELDRTSYKETRSYYTIAVNGAVLYTVRDMKDNGPNTRRTMTYSLKGVLNGVITPSTVPYRIEILKVCAVLGESCDGVPNPADVFTSRRGFMAYSLWSAGQSLTVNGKFVRDHAWCPVKAAINVP